VLTALRLLLPALILASAVPAAAGGVHDRIYPAPTEPLTIAGLPAGAKLVTVLTRDNLTLTGIAVAPTAGMPTLLVFHGNASSAAGTIAWFAPLIARGYGIVAAEYRGYSGNPGKPDEAGLFADAKAFFDLGRTMAGEGRLWVVGHSLGAGVAMGLAGRERLDALVTIGAFTRLRAMAPKLARAFVPDAYDNLAMVPKLDERWLILHGTGDTAVPWQQGEALHKAASAAGRTGASFVLLGADHKPDGKLLAAVFESTGTFLRTGEHSAAGLPANTKLIPFGRSAPLNP
jgi:hypothetical protein